MPRTALVALVAACAEPEFGVIATLQDCEDAGGAIAWHDLDADAWGSMTWCCTFEDDLPASVDPGEPRLCPKAVPISPFNGDCDDGDAAFHPNAEEDCLDPTDYDCDGQSPWIDQDVDGSPSCLDCDDDAPAVYPGATETCNDVDDDCNDVIDDVDHPPTWYPDADFDGFGDDLAPVTSCDAPAGAVGQPGDCDDRNGAVHPAATETCNAIDDDCDALVDEYEAAPATWFHDVDGDTWGDALAPEVSCEAPPGTVANGADCNDRDNAIYPGAPERCNALDDDCDTLVDEDVATQTWYPDADGDGFGDPWSPLVGCAQPDGSITDATDCDDLDPEVFPGAPERCNGKDDDCDTLVDEGVAGGLFFGDPVAGEVLTVQPDGTGLTGLLSGLGSVSDLEIRDDVLWIAQWGSPVVQRASLDGTALTSVYTGAGGGGQGVDVDPSSGLLLFGEYYGALYAGDVDGVGLATPLVSGATLDALLGSVDGIGTGLEIDADAGMAYFFTRSNVSITGRHILAVGLDGTGLADLRQIETQCMDFDPTGGWIWFADVVGGVYQMWQMSTDGLVAAQVFDLADAVGCSGLAVDGAGGRVYYLQDGTGTLWSAALDGSDHVAIATGRTHPQGLALGSCTP